MVRSPRCVFVYEESDPNGIRTRVTAVKGRCPRPLDDRVKSRAISELQCFGARQIGGEICKSATLLTVRLELVDQRRSARGCTFVLAQRSTCVFHETLTRLAVAKKFADRTLKRLSIVNLNGGVT